MRNSATTLITLGFAAAAFAGTVTESERTFVDAQNSTLFHGLTTIEQSGGTTFSSITGSYDIPGATSTGIFNYGSTALAGTGTLGASISLDADGLSFERDLPSVVGDAQAIYSEFFTFSGADPTVSTNLNTFVHGSLVSTCIDCGAGIIVSVIINNAVVASGAVSFPGDSRGVAQVISTSSFTVPTNQPVYIGTKLEVLLSVRAPFEPQDADRYVGDFEHTLTFAPGQVFTLPDGFTVNSACVVNNVSVCTDAADSAVPEPSSLTLAGGALLALAFAFKRSQRRHRAS